MAEDNLNNLAENNFIIEDARKTISRYFWENYWLMTVCLVAIVFILIYSAFYYAVEANDPDVDLIELVAYIVAILISVFSAFLGSIKEKVYKLYFSQFAQMNGLKFIPAGAPPDQDAIFNNPDHRIIVKNEVSGTLSKFPFRLFILKSVKILKGRYENRQIENFDMTVFELTLHSSFPDVFLIPVSGRSVFNSFFSEHTKKLTRVKPNQDHLDFFEIYVRPGYEIEIYQIFSQEFLEFLVQHSGKNLFLNFINNKVYIFKKGIVSNRIDLLEMYIFAREVIKRIGDQSVRLKDDFESLHPYYNKQF